MLIPTLSLNLALGDRLFEERGDLAVVSGEYKIDLFGVSDFKDFALPISAVLRPACLLDLSSASFPGIGESIVLLFPRPLAALILPKETSRNWS